VRAAAVTRDELAWPESYAHDSRIPGYDFAGVIVKVHEDDSSQFQAGDEVFAMIDLHKGAAWAEYTTVSIDHLALKPKALSFEEAATVPMSALTAWQALFIHCGLPEPGFERRPSTGSKAVFITGASGAVGAYAVQLAVSSGLHVVAASSSNKRNGEFLRSLGASEVVEYQEIASSGRTFDTIVDTVGGEPLKQCWSLVTDNGTIVTVNSSSFDFSNRDAPLGKEHVKALFFILEPSGKHLEAIARGLDVGALKAYVAYTFPLAAAVAAYEKASGRLDRRGKVALII
jgi:NADPH2:quinone reductase